MRTSFWLGVVLLSLQAHAQTSGGTTYCNPLDLDYRYNWEQSTLGISYRSGADPVIIYHQGLYYLFATISAGWWQSPDMLHWTYVEPDVWPVQDNCAPAALVVRDTFYIFQSSFSPCPVFFSTRLTSGHLEIFTPLLPSPPGAAGPWDPCVFHDDASDRWYMYWGSSNVFPMYGIELDHSRRFAYIDSARSLLALHPERHGWERFGQDHRETRLPFIEGAWMTAHGGRYYLQYAAPGTEYNVYANGTYVGDTPLGPFTYAPNNPVSYKPGGFVTGAGHGNTFVDRYGNYWNTGTPWIAVNWAFERRVAMFPAAFDGDGLFHADTRFGDFPHRLPDRMLQSPDELFAGWMLLSYRKPVHASSYREGYAPGMVTDENPRTYWLAAGNSADQWVTIDLGRSCVLRAAQVNFADHQSGIFRMDSTVFTQFRLSASLDGATWNQLADCSTERRDRPNAYMEFAQPVRARFVRYEHIHVSARNLAISDVRIFGSAEGPAPAVPVGLTARRHADGRDATITWDPVPGAVGYNVRWGIAPDKLYQTYQVFADGGTRLELRALTIGQDYVVAVEAFNESGVSPLGEVVSVTRP